MPDIRGTRHVTEPMLRISGLTKAYPGVVANDDVSLSVFPGEVHALLGENGAGKSTLVKMIYGLVKPDAGYMQMHGHTFAPSEPRDARADGVAMVFQHFSLFEALSVAENVALGMENPPPPRRLAARIKDVSTAYGLPLGPDRLVGDLSAGERQRVEIIRCLLQDPKLLIMDEPTSVLTPQEVEILFQTLRSLTAEGVSILYISHKLDEIRHLCQRATILRHGRNVGTCDPARTSSRDMAEMMVGSSFAAPARPEIALGNVVLTLNDLDLPPGSHFGIALKGVSFSLKAGEILRIGGVAGNGQDELMSALSGERLTPAEAIQFASMPIGHKGPLARRAMGLLTAPEERLGHAAAPDMSLTENAFLTGMTREKLQRFGMIKKSSARAFAQQIIAQFDVRTPGPDVAARSLSGGNLQKFVIGREVLQAPTVFVVNQPTWGVDAAAAAAIRQALLDLTTQGAAVICISQDLDELLEISNRIAALNGGRLSDVRAARGLNLDEIGLMMGGAHTPEQSHVPA